MRLFSLLFLVALLSACTTTIGPATTPLDGDRTDGDIPDGDFPDGDIPDDDDPDEFPDDGDTPDGELDGDDSAPDCPTMWVSVDTITFGPNIDTLNMVVHEFVIANHSPGPIDLVIQGIAYVSEQPNELTIQYEGSAPPMILRQGGRITVQVTYDGYQAIPPDGSIVIVSNACSGLLTWIPVLVDRGDDGCGKAEPTGHDFGEVPVGQDAQATFAIRNYHARNLTGIMQVLDVSLVSGDARHFHITEGWASSWAPGSVSSCPNGERAERCQHEITVVYAPQRPTVAGTPHRTTLRVAVDLPVCDDSGAKIIDIPLVGRAYSNSIIVNPLPVDFGRTVIHAPGILNPTCSVNADCPTGQHCLMPKFGYTKTCFAVMPLRIFNYSDRNVTFADANAFSLHTESDTANCGAFELWDSENIAGRSCTNDTDCPEGMVCAAFGTDLLCHLPPGGGAAFAPLTMRYAPRRLDVDTCTLRIRSHLPGEEQPVSSAFPVTGKGREANVCPVAQITPSPEGDEPLVVNKDSNVCFYGASSYDPDGVVTEYSWSVLSAPEGFDLSQCYFPDSRHSTLCCPFTEPGQYRIALRVKDDDDCWSEPDIATIEVVEDQWLRVVLTFPAGSGGGTYSSSLVDMDLRTRPPGGYAWCDCTSYTDEGEHSCQWFGGQIHGTMPVCTSGASCCGTREEIRIFYPVNGEWSFSVFYAEDCENWLGTLIQPICAGRATNHSYTLEFFDFKQFQNPVPLWSVSDRLQQAGTFHTYPIQRIDGIWNFPATRTP